MGKVVVTDSSARKPGPSLLVALVVLGVGVLLAITGGVVMGIRAFRVIDFRSVATPGMVERRLTRGSWYVYQRTGTTDGTAGFTFGDNNAPDIAPSQVTVTGPDGNQLAVQLASQDYTVTHNSAVFTSAVQFTVPRAGIYRITIDTSESGQVLVTRTFPGSLGSQAWPLSGLGLGVLLVMTGLTLLFVGLFRRQRAAQPATGAGWSPGWSPGPPPPEWLPAPPLQPPPAPAPAAGWYPDPQAPGTQRWWDGARWTEYRA